MMKRREFLVGIAASALVAPAAAKSHTFKAVNFGKPTDRVILICDGQAQPALVTLVKQPNGGWLIKGGEHVKVGQSFTFDMGHDGPVQIGKPVA